MSIIGSLFKPGIKIKTNFSVTLVTLPSTILPYSILSFDNCEFNNFSNS